MWERLRRWAAMFAVLALAFCPHTARAAEPAATIPNPTRDPEALAYDEKKPDQLMPNQLVAHAFVLMEAESGEILFAQNENEPMYPSSTTKILTSLLAIRYGDLDERITVSEAATVMPEEGASRVGVKAGETMTLLNALYGMMLPSGNDAAIAVAEHIAGSQAAFVEQMNDAAAILGCEQTHFTNAHGLFDPEHYTSARDLAIITREALKEETFRKIVSTQAYTLPATNMNPAKRITNSNVMLDSAQNDYYYPYSIGVKTGTHSQSAYTFVGAAERNGVTLIAVVLYTGMYSRWSDTRRLLEYGFSQYTSVTPQEIYKKDPYELQTTGFSLSDPHLGVLGLNIEAVDPTNVVRITGPTADIERLMDSYRSFTSVEWTREARAPITEGEVMGILTFYPEDGAPAQYNLLAARTIEVREDAPLTLEQIEQMVLGDPWPLPPFAWDWVTPPLLLFAVAVMLLRALLMRAGRRRRDARQIPKPKRRYFR
jgi:D-alanyl-D-alanine carboxypeptidase